MPLTDITNKLSHRANLPAKNSSKIQNLPRNDSGNSLSYDFEIVQLDNLASNKTSSLIPFQPRSKSSTIMSIDDDTSMLENSDLSLLNSTNCSLLESATLPAKSPISIQKSARNSNEEEDSTQASSSNSDSNSKTSSSNTSPIPQNMQICLPKSRRSSLRKSSQQPENLNSNSNSNNLIHSDHSSSDSAIDEKNDSGLDLYIPQLSKSSKRSRNHSGDSLKSSSSSTQSSSNESNTQSLTPSGSSMEMLVNEVETPADLKKLPESMHATPENLPDMTNLEFESQSKMPKFCTKSPEWCSVTHDLIPDYTSHQTHRFNFTKSPLENHPDLTPKMRSILIDWLIEVAEVHQIYRKTFYLAVSYLDQYLYKQTLPIQRSNLQLIGVTCLFIACKLEEIYPPKLKDLVFLTDGACTEEDMLVTELSILRVLDWRLHNTTTLDWINLYLQQAYFPDSPTNSPQKENIDPKIRKSPRKSPRKSKSATKSPSKLPKADIIAKFFPDEMLSQMMQVCDVMLLHDAVHQYEESQLAAAILYHFSSPMVVEKATGLKVTDIRDSISYVTRFALIFKSVEFGEGKDLDNGRVLKEDWVHIQTHHRQLERFEML